MMIIHSYTFISIIVWKVIGDSVIFGYAPLKAWNFLCGIEILIPCMSIISQCTKVEGAAEFFEKADIMPNFLAAMDLNIENGDLQMAALTALAAMTKIPDLLPKIVDPSCMK